MRRITLLLGTLALAAGLQAQTIQVPGLSAEVIVYTDANGIPTIVGETDSDVTFVRGYLHARDRFFQMDFLRRVASGTLAELLGPGALANDIQLRTLGLRRGALASWLESTADERGWLKAYADGVNQFLAANPLPPEYGALELTRAEPWSPVDSLVIGKLLAFQLSFDLDIGDTVTLGTYQAVGNIAGFDGTALYTQDIFRVQPSDGRVTVPGFFDDVGIIQVPLSEQFSPMSEGGTKAQDGDGAPEIGELDPAVVELAAAYAEKISAVPLLANALQRYDDRGASNWWAVSGEHTASGFPLMANDPHLGLDMPSIFVSENYVIRSEGVVVSGVSFAGTPTNVLACNLHICWGATTNPMDVTDVFIEQLRVNNFGLPTHTVHGGVSEPVLLVFQSYFVNNIGDGEADNVTRANVGFDAGAITFIVPRRNFGPILDVDGTQGLSAQYTGWGPTFELSTFHAWARATNLEEFQAGLRNFSFGSQNWIYADVEGNIAYFSSAEMPLRADLQNDLFPDGGIPPWFIRDGTGALNHEWLPVTDPQPGQATPFQILPFNEMPQVINPSSGYIANANNDPVGTSLDNNPLSQLRPGANGIYYLNPGYTDLRMGQIDRKLQDLIERGDITIEDMKELQGNNQFLDAELVLPFLLDAFMNAAEESAWPGLAQFAADPGVQEAIGRLAAWDFSSPTGLAEGFDPGKDPFVPTEPTAEEIAHSTAATIYSVWRGQAIRNTVDATLSAVGLGGVLPGSTPAFRAFHHLLAGFTQNQGVGASGLPFFNAPGAPDPATARDTVLLASLKGALDLLASDAFAPAFGNSTNQDDYRWGRLHRVVFRHPLGASPFNVPNGGGFADLGPGLPGVARSGGFQVIDASNHSSKANTVNGFMFGGGPARRTVAEMTPIGPEAEEIIPGGRSGVLVSPFYTNQLRLWLVNDYLPLDFGEDEASASAVNVTTFNSP